jgi:hypothetical protein
MSKYVKPKVGFLFSVFEGDKKHFNRFIQELKRLNLPFTVNFDHCSDATKFRFKSLPNYLDGYEDDDPNSFFDESFRQRPLELLQKHKFDWAFQLDVDETLERDAINKIYDATTIGADIIDCPVIDLWGSKDKYRIDGGFGCSHREKMFNIHNTCIYTHPTVHAPKVTRKGEIIVKRYDLNVIHWGIMDMDDVKEHTERWNTIYIRKVGGNPYASGFYSYINDPATVPFLVSIPKDLIPEYTE